VKRYNISKDWNVAPAIILYRCNFGFGAILCFRFDLMINARIMIYDYLKHIAKLVLNVGELYGFQPIFSLHM